MTDNPTPIIDRVLEHFSVVAHRDTDGREYGMPYSRVLELILEEFPAASTSRKTLATYAQYVKQGRYVGKLERMGLTIPTFRLPSPPPSAEPKQPETALADPVEETPSVEELAKPRAKRARRARQAA